MGKQARVRIHSGKWFRDFYTDANGAEDWAANKIMGMAEKEPETCFDRYEILSDDRITSAAALMGSAKSEKKTASSRKNGKLGGRPKKTAKCIYCNGTGKRVNLVDNTYEICLNCEAGITAQKGEK